MSDKTPLELAKRVIGAINHLDNPLMSDLKILAAALIERESPVEICGMVNAPLIGKCRCDYRLSLLHQHKYCPNCGKSVTWK